MSNSFVSELRITAGSRREAALNWLALGLLLAAWNASDNDAGASLRPRPEALLPKPEALRGYDYVSVRAANRLKEKSW
jgi:hypothetical protein